MDAHNRDLLRELAKHYISVRLVGTGYLYSAFWDEKSFFCGIEPIYEDMYDHPDYLHRITQKFVD